MLQWLKKWFPIQFRWGNLQEQEKDVRVRGFVIKVWRFAVAGMIYIDLPDQPGG